MMIQIHDATFDDTFDYKHQHKQKGGSTTTASKTNMFRASYHYLTYRFQYIYIYIVNRIIPVPDMSVG
jgi:hypothetical protein